MSSLHQHGAPKKSASLGINSGLLNTAKERDINLPARDKLGNPRYQNLSRADIPVVELEEGLVRVIAGEFQGVRGPALTNTRMSLLDARLLSGREAVFATEDGDTG